jgi:hypothetical protein
LSTTKFYNFLRSTTFVLLISPSEDILKIQILNLRNSNKVFHEKMTSNKKVVNYKLYKFSRSTTFIFVVSLSEDILKIQISNLRNSNKVFLEKITSNEKVVDYKVV